MEAIKTSSTGQGLGVAGFVISLIAFFFSVIPDIGVWSLIPGIVALIFCAVAFSQAKRSDSPKGLFIAGLAVSILVLIIAFSQIYVGYKLVKFGTDEKKIEAFTKELQKGIESEFGEEEMENLEKAMEELEGEIEEITEDNAEEIGKATGKAMKEFSKEIQKAAEELEKEEDSIKDE